MSLKVLFVHGLEGNPQGSKARFLTEHFDTVVPAMNTSDFGASVETIALAARQRPPDVLVGSSFGGAVALRLLQRGDHRGPALLLAPAARHFGVEERIPEGVRVVIVHGTRDTVVDVEGSRRLAATGTAGLVELREVDDEHRLATLVDSGELAALVELAAKPCDG